MRINKTDLQKKVDYLNKLTGQAWQLSQAYGGYAVARVVTAGGGESHLFRYIGHMPAKELSIRLDSYIQGIEDYKEDCYCDCERCGAWIKCNTSEV